MSDGEFRAELARRLRGVDRLVVVGIGDELHPRDRLGIVAARRLSALGCPGVTVIPAGTVPESFSAPIRRARPQHVLLLDAADLVATPGSLAVINGHQVVGSRLSTHALPLSVFMRYLEDTVRVPVTLVGLQPDLSSQAAELTAKERSGVGRLVGMIRSLRERPDLREG